MRQFEDMKHTNFKLLYENYCDCLVDHNPDGN